MPPTSTKRSPPSSTSPTESQYQAGVYISCAGPRSAMDESHMNVVKWPPLNLRRTDELGPEQAEDLISHGAATFHGYHDHTYYDQRRFYAVVANRLCAPTDQPGSSEQVTKYMSSTLIGVPDSAHPWRSLEQPSLLSCFGDGAGSVTLNYWLGTFGDNRQVVEDDGTLKTREVGLLWLLKRIRHLEFGLDADVRTPLLLIIEPLAAVSNIQTSRTVFDQPYTKSSYLILTNTRAFTAQSANK